MSRESLRTALFETIREVQILSGEAAPDLNEAMCPQFDIPEFDSLRYIEVETLLSRRLGRDLDFRSLRGPQPLRSLTLGEVIDHLSAYLDAEAK